MPISRGSTTILLVFLAIATGCYLLGRRGSRTWEGLLVEVRERFPEVHQMSTLELADRMGSGAATLIVDVRADEEFAISRLPGARHVPMGSGFESRMEALGQDRPVVLYCSVGYRSSEGTRRLLRAGWKGVSNLEGSIFAWANEGRPLEGPQGPATRVHPYDESWGELLIPSRRSTLP